jgi:hypothetical protein
MLQGGVVDKVNARQGRCDQAELGHDSYVHAFHQSDAFRVALDRHDWQTATRIAFGVFAPSLGAASGALGEVHVALARRDRFAPSGLAAIAEAIHHADAPLDDARKALEMMSVIMSTAVPGGAFEAITTPTVESIEALAASEGRARGNERALLRYIRIAPDECEHIGEHIDALGLALGGAMITPESREQFATLVQGTRQRWTEMTVTLGVLLSLIRATRA